MNKNEIEYLNTILSQIEFVNVVEMNEIKQEITRREEKRKIKEGKSKAELLEEHRNDNPTLYLTKDKDGNVLFNDLCAGPHILSTGKVKAIKLTLLIFSAFKRSIQCTTMLFPIPFIR